MNSLIHNLKSLVLSNHPLLVIETVEEERVEEILGQRCDAEVWTLFDWSLSSGLVNRRNGSVLVQPDQTLTAFRRILDIDLPAIFLFRDLESQLEDPLLSRQFREMVHNFQTSDQPMAIVLCGDRMTLPKELEPFTTFVELELPNTNELETILHHTLNGLKERIDFSIEIDGSKKHELIRALKGLTANQARQKLTYAVVEDGKLCPADIASLTHEKARVLKDGGLLEYCPVADNHFEIGGFDNLKKWLDRAAVGFSSEAAAMNLRPPRGILLVGVQGCGKSLSAKAIARQWQIPLLKLDAGRLFDKFVGESEKNLRKALSLAQSLSPCVLWIDEIEKGFATGDGDSADGGTAKRMLATFLTWMQEKKEEVFLVGTANNLNALPPEFLRKGRFDEIFFVDLPTPEERQVIIGIHLRLRKQAIENFDLHSLVAATDGFSGAEIEQAVISALYRSLHEKVPLITECLLDEFRKTVPLSVSRKEDIDRLRAHAAERFVPVTSKNTPLQNAVTVS